METHEFKSYHGIKGCKSCDDEEEKGEGMCGFTNEDFETCYQPKKDKIHLWKQ